MSAHQSNSVTNTISPNNKKLDIGELANITPNDENKWEFNQATDKEKSGTDSKSNMLLNETHEWTPRFILKSHFDCVRCIRFHNEEPLIVTGSEDETIKLWNIYKTPLASNKSEFFYKFQIDSN